jgi:hypothetical protein
VKKEMKMSKDIKSLINASNEMSFKSSNSCIDLKPAKKRIKIQNEDFCQILPSVPVKYTEEVIDSEDDSIEEIYKTLNQNRNANNKTKSSTNKPLNANSTQSQTSVFDNNSLSKRIKLEKNFIDEKQKKFKINRTESPIIVNTLTQSSQQLIPSTSTQTSYESQTQTYSEVNNNLNPINLHCFSGAQTISHSTPTRETKVLQFHNKIEGIDKMLIIKNLENCNDIQILTAIKQELERMSSAVKEEYYRHGIRLNDGFGINAYLCLKCNVSLNSLLEVIKHLENFGRSTNESLVDSTANTNEQHINTKPHQISSAESRFRSEGIFSSYDYEHKTMKYCCVFCDLYFETEEALNLHISCWNHFRKAFKCRKKQCFNYENQDINERDFTVESQRINEFEVKFARIKIRSTFEKKFKKQIKKEGIRLKDGIGFDAIYCLKCDYSLAVYSIKESKTIISLHLESRQHLENRQK